ncbi:MAG: hypothetical protein A2268_13565 [Candidatus Raymondbacteria bacterium RifOxyA12_full_50_37]|uniref:Calcineurin-like phosphoesterase domain-containing protein n=1 Tax=Candidatus Raymondbacteria bacterium RIFOXYD12_FULL_49_13 TaxID=1817890 RepID=A0A1F7F8S5_UNCRA|nr:MAG: hypothetical protein A2350_08225 [Candidatus Raymondbacteria bacterium RifOxyB12_full_50_8]OGJ90415.1 MAG: hypothetical protein A2268_13565 [Candidatus Raymondbacteria bacterium RifOxyA12_full_50_37]OGJ91503.1 MAG: hypothetical protein A2248_03630 [Candidatus Raymondbacteria bacterium RIFOXYA2_FULL_49_16]OGJ97817.1 MAG: hypothetical protein A2453_14015 [Candidatus Raymondbacteria bacterium RIFOXYC2_FULL_50_21]OGK02103.1 MAG: hypothetical protein A2487_20865 [Candidatus Raymondbacteria b
MIAVMLAVYFNVTSIFSTPDHIHFGSINNPLNGLTVTWHSSSQSDSIRWGYTAAFEQGAFPCTARADYSGYLHDYRFPILNPEDSIYYSIKDADGWSAVRNYMTSTDTASTDFVFIAGGDSRTTDLVAWDRIAGRLAQERVDFHLFLGDNVFSASSATDWDLWYSEGDPMLTRNCVYYTAGNHEYGPIFLNQFIMPGNRQITGKPWYSFVFGNALFVCLFTAPYASWYALQYPWLDSLLAADTHEWKVVFFHKPFFTIGTYAGNLDAYLDTWWKSFDDHGVDVIFNGHTHNYQRTKPINRNVSTAGPVGEYGSGPDQGRLQIISASYAPIAGCGADWFVDTCAEVNHYCKIRINGKSLHLDAIMNNGAIFDSITLVKPVTGAHERRAAPAAPHNIVLSPNPAFGGRTSVVLPPGALGDAIIELYSVSGKRLLTVRPMEGAAEYRLQADVPAGIYIVRVKTGGRLFTKNLMIAR